MLRFGETKVAKKKFYGAKIHDCGYILLLLLIMYYYFIINSLF